jgi:hypothetical protein
MKEGPGTGEQQRKDAEMTRKPRALGVALLAMLAMSAVAASAAQAATEFEAGNGTGTAKYKMDWDPSSKALKLKTDVGNLRCEGFHAEGTGNATTPSATLAGAEYSECAFAGLEGAVVEINNCTETVGASGQLYLGPDGCEATVTNPAGCTLTIEGVQYLSGLTYTGIQESGKHKELKVAAAVEGIHYSWTGECEKSSGSDTNGTYTGTFKLQATDANNNPLDLAVANVKAGFIAGNGTGSATFKFVQDSTVPQIFTAPAPLPAVECKAFNAVSTGKATAETVELASVGYGECQDNHYFEVAANIYFNTCNYYMNSNGNLNLGPAGCEVHISEVGRECPMTVPGGQSFLLAVTYINVQESGKPKEVMAHLEFSGIHYSYSGYNCGTGSDTNGTYKGNVRLKAYTEGGTQEDLTVG